MRLSLRRSKASAIAPKRNETDERHWSEHGRPGRGRSSPTWSAREPGWILFPATAVSSAGPAGSRAAEPQPMISKRTHLERSESEIKRERGTGDSRIPPEHDRRPPSRWVLGDVRGDLRLPFHGHLQPASREADVRREFGPRGSAPDAPTPAATARCRVRAAPRRRGRRSGRLVAAGCGRVATADRDRPTPPPCSALAATRLPACADRASANGPSSATL